MAKAWFKNGPSNQQVCILAGVVIVVLLYRYSQLKSSNQNSGAAVPAATDTTNPSGMSPQSVWQAGGYPAYPGGQPSASKPLGQNSGYAKVGGGGGGSAGSSGVSACSAKATNNPASLLPSDANSQWASMNPQGNGSLQNVNLLQAGYNIGINTVGSSLRNANLQLRSEPPNPQGSVGPWNTSTIQPDVMRVPLEIGCGPQ